MLDVIDKQSQGIKTLHTVPVFQRSLAFATISFKPLCQTQTVTFQGNCWLSLVGFPSRLSWLVHNYIQLWTFLSRLFEREIPSGCDSVYLGSGCVVPAGNGLLVDNYTFLSPPLRRAV
jgi:hypothetical protein